MHCGIYLWVSPQREYYATHQYFLSKRSLYLVVWKVTEGEAGVQNLLQWLVNIQARAPNTPVIIVGTHLDQVKKMQLPVSHVADMYQLIRDRCAPGCWWSLFDEE